MATQTPPLNPGKQVPYLVDTKYKEKRRAMPRQPDPTKRKKSFYLQVAESLYSSHLRNRTGLKYNDQVEFYNNRLYAMGEQSMEKYIEYFFKETSSAQNSGQRTSTFSVDANGGFSKQTSGAKRKGWMNVMFDIVSDAPKIVSSLVRKYEKAEYDIVVDAIDEASGVEVENEKYKLWATKENLEFKKKYYGNMNLEYEEPEFIPETEDEMQLWEDNGGFKPVHAMVNEQIINHSFELSDWNEQKKSMVEDAIVNGYFASRVRWDPEIGKAKAEYVDIARFIIQHSKFKDFRDSEWAGEFIEVPFTTLKQKGFKPDELIEMSRNLAGQLGNPVTQLGMNQQGAIETDDMTLWKVSVLDFEFITTDHHQHLVRKNKFGKEKFIKQEYGTKNKEKEGKQSTQITGVKTRYVARWIVGTEHIYDEGRAYDVPRANPKEVKLSYRAYRIGTKSIIKTLIPIFDNLMIIWVKYQNAIAMAVNDGYVIDYDSISSIKMGGDSYSEEMVIQRFLQTGIMIVKRKGVKGNPKAYAPSIPVTHIPGGLGSAFTTFREGFNQNLQMIERLTGFTPMITGGTPEERGPVKTAELSVDATNDFLGNILSGYMKIKQEVAEEFALLSQMKIKQGWTEGFEGVIGKKNIQVLKIADSRKAMYGFSIVARPTELQRKELYESAKISLNNGRDGKPGINEADHFRITRILENGGSLKKAEMVLNASIRRSQREAEERATRATKMNQEGTMKLEQQKHGNEKELIILKEAEKRKTEVLIHNNAKELLELEPKPVAPKTPAPAQ